MIVQNVGSIGLTSRFVFLLVFACGSIGAYTVQAEEFQLPDEKLEKAILGKWQGKDWGVFQLHATKMSEILEGTYTDTYNGKAGKLRLNKTAENKFEGTWTETDKARYGKLEIVISPDKKALHIKWQAGDGNPNRPKSGASKLTRKKK